MATIELKINANYEEAIKGSQDLTASTKALEKETEDYNKTVQKSMKNAVNATEKQNKTVRRQKGLIEDLEDTIKDWEIKLRKATNTKDIEKYNRKIAEGRLNLEDYKKKGLPALKSVNKEATVGARVFRRLGGAIAAAFSVGLLVRGLRNAFNIVKRFDQAVGNLAAVTGKSKEELKALTDSARALELQTKFTAAEVINLQLEFGKLGFTVEDILEVQEASLKLAQAWNIDLARTATLVGGTIRGFGLDVSETNRVLDLLAKSTTISALSVEKLETALGVVAPVAKGAGASIERTVALLGTLVDANIDASSAGTALRNIFLTLAGSGMTFDEAMEEINTSANKLATSFELFDKRGATVGLVLADNTEKTEEYTEALNDANGVLDEMAAKQIDTIAGQTTLLASAWSGLVKAIADGESAELIKEALGGTAQILNALAGGGAKLDPLIKAELDLVRLERERVKLNERLEELADEGTFLDSIFGEPAVITLAKEQLEEINNEMEDLKKNIAGIRSVRELGDIQFPGTVPQDVLFKAIESGQERIKNLRAGAIEDQEKKAKKQTKEEKKRAEEKQDFLNKLELEGFFITQQFRDLSLEDLKKHLKEEQDLIKFNQQAKETESQIEADLEKFFDEVQLEDDKEFTREHIKLLKQRLGEFKTELTDLEQFAKDHPFWEAFGLTDEDQIAALKRVGNDIVNVITGITDTWVQNTELIVRTLDTRISEQQRALDAEIRLAEQGFASNVTLKREELAALQEERDKALANQQQALKVQQGIEAVSQGISLATSVSNLLRVFTGVPFIGLALAAGAIATMFNLWSNAKTQIADSVQFAEGGEVKEGEIRGNSHAKGGVKIEAEGGEYIIKKQQYKKYPDLVKAINNDELRVRDDLIKNFNISETKLSLKETAEIKEIRDMMRKIMNKKTRTEGNGYVIEEFGNVRRKING